MNHPGVPPILHAQGISHAYGRRAVLHDLSLTVQRGEFTSIIGPNGSGKSTCLRILGRMLRPGEGVVTLDGRDTWSMSPREFASRVAFVPQAPTAPADLVVEELVWRGRYPHRGLLGRAGDDDRAAVEQALALAGVVELRERALGTLSGGERQRAWIALALAQEPDLLLLDEPTTFLDIAHQVDLLSLLSRLNAEQGLTVVMVIHDLAQAAQSSRRLVALRDGAIVVDGPPAEVVTAEHVRAVFGVEVRVYRDPASGALGIVPAAVPLAEA